MFEVKSGILNYGYVTCYFC